MAVASLDELLYLPVMQRARFSEPTPELSCTQAQPDDLGMSERNGKLRYDELTTIVIHDDDGPSRKIIEAFAKHLELSPGVHPRVVSFSTPDTYEFGQLYIIDYQFDNSARTGFTLAQDIRARNPYASIALVSALDRGDILWDGKLPPNIDYSYTKPFTEVDFLSLVQKIRGNHEENYRQRFARRAQMAMHDAKNGLQVLDAELSLLLVEGDATTEELHERLTYLRRQVRTVASALMGAKEVVLPSVDVDLRALVRDTYKAFRPSMAGQGLKTDLFLPEEDIHVNAPVCHLTLSLENYFKNAISNAKTSVHAGMRVEGNQVTVYVTNDGEPIPEERRAHIFNNSRQYEERGWGLRSAKRYIERLSGTVACTQEADGRTTFSYSLPIA